MCFYGILRGAIECLDSQMLFDPFEKQFDLPSTFVKIGDGLCWEGEVVGQKHQTLVGFRIEVADSSEFRRIVLLGIEVCGGNGLIALHPAGFVDVSGITSGKPEVVLGSDDKESCRLVDGVQTGKVEIAAIEDIDGAGFYGNLVEDVDLVNLAVGYDNHVGDTAPQIQKSVKLDRALVLSKDGPGKKRQTQIDGGGIQGIYSVIQIYPEGLADIKFSCLVDQDLGEVGVDSPVPHLIGIGQGISGDLPPYAHVIEFVLGAPETGLNISQAFPVGQLGKRHAEKLVPA